MQLMFSKLLFILSTNRVSVEKYKLHPFSVHPLPQPKPLLNNICMLKEKESDVQ